MGLPTGFETWTKFPIYSNKFEYPSVEAIWRPDRDNSFRSRWVTEPKFTGPRRQTRHEATLDLIYHFLYNVPAVTLSVSYVRDHVADNDRIPDFEHLLEHFKMHKGPTKAGSVCDDITHIDCVRKTSFSSMTERKCDLCKSVLENRQLVVCCSKCYDKKREGDLRASQSVICIPCSQVRRQKHGRLLHIRNLLIECVR